MYPNLTPKEREDAFLKENHTALIMQKMNVKPYLHYLSVDYYHLPENHEEEFTLDFKTYTKFVSQLYPDKEAALKEPSVTALGCNRCKSKVTRKIDWFAGSGGGLYYALCECPRHGYVKGKLRIRKGPGEEIFIVKTVKPATEEDVKEIEARKEAVRERRIRRVEKEKAKRRARRAEEAALAGTKEAPAAEKKTAKRSGSHARRKKTARVVEAPLQNN